MAITLTLPGLGSQGLSSKDAIISILSVRWPLSLKQIHQIAKTEYAISATYQAVHKMVSQLVEEGLIVKNQEGFSLNPTWIQKIKSFSSQLDRVYSKEHSFADFQNKDIINLYFDNFIEMARFIIHSFNGGEFPNPERKVRVAMMQHTWMPIGANENDFAQIKKIFEIPYYGLYQGNTVLDHFANQLLVKMGKKSIHGVNYPADGDILVEGEYVAQIFYPLELKLKIDDLFKKTKSIEKFDMVKMFEIYSQKNQVKVVISRNPDLAESLRREGIKLYEKNQQTQSKTNKSKAR